MGLLTPFVSNSGYRIHPVVGLVAGAPILTPNPGEVAEVFEVPLAFLMNPANHPGWQPVRSAAPSGRSTSWTTMAITSAGG